jgi:hypothetical protein
MLLLASKEYASSNSRKYFCSESFKQAGGEIQTGLLRISNEAEKLLSFSKKS